VGGLGHCGDCHSPRNLAGAVETGHVYAGGDAEGWYAPALDASNPAPLAWTIDSLEAYLRTGMNVDHGADAGTMAPVARDLALAPDADVRAIARYVVSLMYDTRQALHDEPPVDREAEAARDHPVGATLFLGACGECHQPGAPMMGLGRASLSVVSAIQEANPRNTVQVMFQGLQPPVTARGPYMPAFADALTDGQMVELAAYMRARYSTRPAWRDVAKTVAVMREENAQP
jgi:mono/diheme cytochrome c family protein